MTAMNGDINARRDAASLMMSMSHMMDAAAADKTKPSISSSSLQTPMNGMNTNAHHNHTSRGPHKKRSASNAALDDSSMSSPVAQHARHVTDESGVLRAAISGSSPTLSELSTTAGAIGGKGKTSTTKSSSSNSTALTEEEKKAERRAANRRSAFQSRQRRKILIEDLQRTVAALSKDNNDLRKSNEDIRSQLEAALVENRQLRQITTSLSAQAHAQTAPHTIPQTNQVPQPPQHPSTSTSSPSIAAKQTPVSQPVPAISGAQSTPVAPSSFNPAALTNFLTSLTSQVGPSGTTSSDQHQHIFNAKLALMAAQSRVSELEQHQAAQAVAATQQQIQAQAAAFGLGHIQQALQSSPASANPLVDPQYFARLQELLSLGISSAPMAGPPTQTTQSHSIANSINACNAAGVDLTHLRSLLEAQQRQRQQQSAGAPVSKATESSVSVQSGRNESTQSITETSKISAGNNAVSVTSESSNASSPLPTVTPPTPAPPSSLPTCASHDAPGITLLIESLRSGQMTGSVPGSSPALDEAVRNYLQQQQLKAPVSSTVKAESNGVKA